MGTDMVLPTSTCAGKVSRRFVPKTFRTQDESYPVQDESYPVDLGMKRPGQIVPKCIWVRFDQDVSYPNLYLVYFMIFK